jgi:hypothetical protein
MHSEVISPDSRFLVLVLSFVCQYLLVESISAFGGIIWSWDLIVGLSPFAPDGLIGARNAMSIDASVPVDPFPPLEGMESWPFAGLKNWSCVRRAWHPEGFE